jgi:TRAP-type transport system periplasmic protein
MRVRRKLGLTGAALALLALAACSVSSQSSEGNGASSGGSGASGFNQTVNIRWATQWNTDYAAVQADEYFAQQLSKLSGGKIHVQLYLNGSLNGAQGAFQGVENGTIQGTTDGATWLSGISPEVTVLSLPFLFNTTSSAMAVYNGPIGAKIGDELANHGVKLLGWYNLEFNDMINARHPVSAMAQFDGLKIRVINNPSQIAEYKALGATPVPLDFTEVVSGIQSNTLDGAITTTTNSLTLKFYEVAKYYTVLNDSFYAGFMGINESFFNSLPKNYQDLIVKVAKEASAKEVGLMDASDKTALSQLEAKGVSVSVVSPSQLAAMKTAMKPVYAAAQQQYGAALVNEVLAASNS